MLITEEYRKEQERLHKKGGYGVIGKRFGPMVGEIVDRLEIDHLLDYGCGKNQSLRTTLRPKRSFTYQAYDPGVEDYAGDPVPAQMVVCCDVLEHIEPDLLENVLDHLEELTQLVLFATVHMGPAGKTLSDGRNAHLIQKPMEWWLPKFHERWDVQTVQKTDYKGFLVIANAKGLELVDEQTYKNG